MPEGASTLDVGAAAARIAAEAAKAAAMPDLDQLANPDMTVLRLARREPPPFPLAVLGDEWGKWTIATAEAAACPVDNVIAPLLASASALIGHARWAQAAPGWAEPPHLWCGVVGDSGTGKSPGADALLRDVLPEIERRMLAHLIHGMDANKGRLSVGHDSPTRLFHHDLRTSVVGAGGWWG